MVFQIVDLLKEVWEVPIPMAIGTIGMADGFENLPYNDLAALAGGRLGA